MKTEEKRSRPKVNIPPCRCRHGHASHTHGSGTSGLSLGACKATDCPCPDWAPAWLRRYTR